MIAKINVSRWPEGTPERTYAEFVQAWQQKNFVEMLNKAQVSWCRDNTERSVTEIQGMFSGLECECLLYIDPVESGSLNSAVIYDILACLRIKSGKVRKVVKFVPRLIKEDAEGKPDENGIWGVNPVSAFKKLAKEKV